MARTATRLKDAAPRFGRILHRFAPHLRQQRVLLVLGALALFAEVAMRLLEPWPLAVVIDRLAPAVHGGGGVADGIGNTLLVAATALAGVVALRALASYAMTICFALAGNRVLTGVRAELFAHLTSLSMSFHHRRRTGDLVTRVTGDIGRLQEVTVTAALPLLGNVVTLLGMMVVVLILDWVLAVTALLVFPLFALLSVRSTRKITTVSRAQRGAEGDLASMATESLSAMPVVTAYSLQNRLQDRFAGSNTKSLRDGVRAKKLSAGLERSTDVLVGLATAVVLLLGARRVLSGALSLGELTVFLTYLKTAFKPMRDIAKYTGRLAKAAASGERIIDILDERTDLAEPSWARPAPALRGYVQFDRVRVNYPGGPAVLDGFDLQVRPGEQVALVGGSGAGKSTLVSLLSRIRDPDQGRVLIDGHDITDFTVQSLRAQITVLLQDSVLFVGTIRENIAMGASGEVTEQQVVAAARVAGAEEFILALPGGYDSVVGERGATLSGGQRQRIAIARAAIRQAPIVVLDEPFTGLDAGTEAGVRAALARLTRGRTTFLITHDPAHAADADRVVTLAGGRVGNDTAPAGQEVSRGSG